MKLEAVVLWARFDPVTGELLTIHRSRRLARDAAHVGGVIRRVAVWPLSL